MPFLLVVLLGAAIAETGFSLWLSRRQIAHVTRHQNAVPAEFSDVVTPAEHRKAADYTVARERLAMVRSIVSLLIGAAWLLGGFDRLYAALALITPPSIGRSVLFVLAIAAVSEIIALPFAVYRTFVVEQRFGFNRATPRLFAFDKLKGWAIALAVAVPLLAGCFWVMRNLAGLWWLYVWLGVVAVMVAAPTIYVRWIAPRFNRFTPLPDGELRRGIEGLMRACGFRAAGLFTMDASKRSAHGNAYFIGFGRSKRIVLFDTLVEGSAPAEIQAVIAHELGHFHYRHVLFGLLRAAAITFVALFAFGWLARQPWLLPALGLAHADDALSLIAGMLCWSILGPFLSLAGNWLSRRNEFQADDFARAHVGAAPIISALVKLSRENASTLTPDRLYALYHYSHPPVPLRVARVRGRSGGEPPVA